jgi:hypothetical protein
MTHTTNDIRRALIAEHAYYAHDDDTLQSVDEFTQSIAPMLRAELIAETCTDDTFTLDEFIAHWL